MLLTYEVAGWVRRAALGGFTLDGAFHYQLDVLARVSQGEDLFVVPPNLNCLLWSPTPTGLRMHWTSAELEMCWAVRDLDVLASCSAAVTPDSHGMVGLALSLGMGNNDVTRARAARMLLTDAGQPLRVAHSDTDPEFLTFWLAREAVVAARTAAGGLLDHDTPLPVLADWLADHNHDAECDALRLVLAGARSQGFPFL